MKSIVLMFLLVASVSAFADQHVNGYTRSDGTYVQPYQRTAPDGNTYNNYSTQGNTNPYTGQRGYENPQPQPSQNYQPMRPMLPYPAR